MRTTCPISLAVAAMLALAVPTEAAKAQSSPCAVDSAFPNVALPSCLTAHIIGRQQQPDSIPKSSWRKDSALVAEVCGHPLVNRLSFRGMIRGEHRPHCFFDVLSTLEMQHRIDSVYQWTRTLAADTTPRGCRRDPTGAPCPACMPTPTSCPRADSVVAAVRSLDTTLQRTTAAIDRLAGTVDQTMRALSESWSRPVTVQVVSTPELPVRVVKTKGGVWRGRLVVGGMAVLGGFVLGRSVGR
jgi:hypothetical protein